MVYKELVKTDLSTIGLSPLGEGLWEGEAPEHVIGSLVEIADDKTKKTKPFLTQKER